MIDEAEARERRSGHDSERRRHPGYDSERRRYSGHDSERRRHSGHDSERRHHRGDGDSRIRCDKSSLKRSSDDNRRNFDSFNNYKSSNSRGWRKSKQTEETTDKSNDSNRSPPHESTPCESRKSEQEPDRAFLSDAEMNNLASKIVKAEIMGNEVSRDTKLPYSQAE